MGTTRDIAALRQLLAGLEAGRLPGARETFSLGRGALERVPLAAGALHEVRATRGADLPAATGFTLALARRASGEGGRTVLWVRQDFVEAQAGRPDAFGLAEFGLGPDRLILVRAPNAVEVLRAAGDAVRCAALGALIVEPWGEPKALDLGTSRRLAQRAASSGVTSFLLRAAPSAAPTAVSSRWAVSSAPSAPRDAARVANAPGQPAFAATLLRHRGGVDPALEGMTWHLEWNLETCSFHELAPLSGAVVPVPSRRPDRAASAPAQEGGVVRLGRTG